MTYLHHIINNYLFTPYTILKIIIFNNYLIFILLIALLYYDKNINYIIKYY